MKIDERRIAIVNFLKKKQDEVVSILEIADEVNASARTIKNDLKFLSEFCSIKRTRGNCGGVQLTENSIFDRIVSIISFNKEQSICLCGSAYKLGYIPVCFQLYFSIILENIEINDAYDFECFVIAKSQEIWVAGDIGEENSLLRYAKKNRKTIKYYNEA